jgi:serine/threonine protein kinase
MPKKGQRISSAFETYTVEEHIGGGGSGVVFRVKDSQQTELAAKVLKTGFSNQKLRRFKNEMTFCSKQDHRNLIRVFDHGRTQDDEPFYVMPLASSTMRSLIKAGIGLADVLPLFSQMLDGVEAAHLKGATHRDLKPENILIDKDGVVKIADFGIAHFEEDELLTPVETATHERLANWEYAAPEQRRPGQLVDHRADIYALGLMLNEMFTQKVPHGVDPTSISSVAPEYVYVDEIVNSMIQSSVERRVASIGKIKNVLIARKNDFIHQQRLEALTKTVIPASEVSDPLIDNPIQLIDVDYRNGQLVFMLSQAPNGGWLRHFHNMGSYGSIGGSGPEYFGFSENKATVPANEQTVQFVVNHFKNYLQRTNMLYAENLKAQAAQQEEQQRRQLREALKRETMEQEVRRRVRSQLKF